MQNDNQGVILQIDNHGVNDGGCAACFTQFRTESRCTLFLELLSPDEGDDVGTTGDRDGG
ncbi:hypothetical protein GGQ99_004589 [Aminobacter niigataensis]|uniref:Uncharacterized protein n=1 Tax=Aminobacter niigataensis TaxID=83265 RepID=A0ABR6L7M9_9HYPH|nr:hypothetical protein [Aminobacter niigataensis]MBB4652808.1 hypothetical protein [Aminobacter niigataensis]